MVNLIKPFSVLLAQSVYSYKYVRHPHLNKIRFDLVTDFQI